MAATEIAFANTFLSLLDSKPNKIAPDHVEDAHNYPATTPYTLPRLPTQPPLPKPPSLSQKSSLPGSEPSISITIRSLRNPPLEIKLPSLPLSTTSALDLKTAVSEQADIALDKVKLLYGKKPVGSDSKTLREILGEGHTGTTAEFSVMIMGGAAALGTGGKRKDEPAAVAQGLSGEGVLETEEFWGDLTGFLQQRIRDEKVAGEVAGLFKGAWNGRG